MILDPAFKQLIRPSSSAWIEHQVPNLGVAGSIPVSGIKKMENHFIPKEVYEEIFSKVPRLCIDLIIKNNQGILFTKRAIKPFKGQWHLPGGRVFFKEPLEEAAKRIAKRELGISLSKFSFYGFIEYLSEKSIKEHSVTIVFLSEIKEDKITLNDEASEYLFSKKTPINTIPDLEKFMRKNKHLFDSI